MQPPHYQDVNSQLPTSSPQLACILWLNVPRRPCSQPQGFDFRSLRNTWELFECGSIKTTEDKQDAFHNPSANCRVWWQTPVYQIPSAWVFWITKHVNQVCAQHFPSSIKKSIHKESISKAHRATAITFMQPSMPTVHKENLASIPLKGTDGSCQSHWYHPFLKQHNKLLGHLQTMVMFFPWSRVTVRYQVTEKARRGNKMIAQQEKCDGGAPAWLSAQSKVMEIQHEPKWVFGSGHQGTPAGAILARTVFVRQLPVWAPAPASVLLCRESLTLPFPSESWDRVRIPLMSLNSLGSSKWTWVRLLSVPMCARRG